jgi:hypothetical protein
MFVLLKQIFLLIYSFYSLGWFGLRRDLCEIILGHCPFVSLYFNNQFKFVPRPSTNDLIIDLPNEKNLEPLNMNKLSSKDTNNEKHLTTQYPFMSLLEPD